MNNAAARTSLSRARRSATRAATRMLTSRSYDLSDTILVVGSPRSGTTWIGQSVASIPSSAVLFEPLHLERVPAAREAGFAWRTYVRPGTEWPEGERFLARVLHGRLLNDWTTREIRWPRRVKTWIVKCIRMNRLLPWLTERFATRAPLLVLRHPCAVVASQISAGWARPTEHPDPALLSDFPAARDVIASLQTDDEHRAAGWALDTLVPLSAAGSDRWLTVAYERVIRSDHGLDKAFERWGIPRPARVGTRMRIPSSTTTRTADGGRKDPRTAWTTQLTAEQVRRILGVTQALGLDFYGDDPDPDLAALSRWGVEI